MPEVVTIGPVLLPTLRTGLLVLLLLGIFLSGRLARRFGAERTAVAGLAESSVIAGLLAARLGFVLQHLDAYASQPWTVLYIWQPGFDWWSGAAGVLLWLSWRYRRGLLDLPRLRALAAGFTLPLVGIATLAGALHWSRLHGEDAVAGMLPPAVLQGLDGETLDTSLLGNRPLVINFWASWCPPCLRELPLLNRVQAQYRAAGLRVIGINVGEEAETVRRFLKQTPLDFQVWLDPGYDTAGFNSLHSRLRVRGLPTTYFVSADGMIRGRYVGELSEALTSIRIAELLDN